MYRPFSTSSLSSVQYFHLPFPVISIFRPVNLFYKIWIANHIMTKVASLNWYFYIQLLLIIFEFVATWRYILIPRFPSTFPYSFSLQPRRTYIARELPSPVYDINPRILQLPCFTFLSVCILPISLFSTIVFFHGPSHHHFLPPMQPHVRLRMSSTYRLQFFTCSAVYWKWRLHIMHHFLVNIITFVIYFLLVPLTRRYCFLESFKQLY